VHRVTNSGEVLRECALVIGIAENRQRRWPHADERQRRAGVAGQFDGLAYRDPRALRAVSSGEDRLYGDLLGAFTLTL
jgi:hypothetical protein